MPGTVDREILRAAEQALGEGKTAAEITALLAPAFDGSPAMIAAALEFLARDKKLLAAADYPPVNAVHRMDVGFARRQFATVRESWRIVKPYYSLLPAKLKRGVDYQLGVSLVNLNEAARALCRFCARRARAMVPASSANRLINSSRLRACRPIPIRMVNFWSWRSAIRRCLK